MTRKSGSKNKNHIEYICPECLKNFGCYKYHYVNHINKKKSCKKDKDYELDNNEINIELENNNKANNNDIYINDTNITDNENNNILGVGNDSDNKNIDELSKKMDYLIKQNEELKKK